MIDFLNDIVPFQERQAIQDRASTFNVWPLLSPLIGPQTSPSDPELVESIYFRPGQYWSDETWELKRIVRLLGDGTGNGNRGSNSEISFRPGIIGVQFNHRFTLANGLEDPETTQSGGTVITGMAFRSQGKSHADATLNDHGIKMRIGGVLRDCVIRDFGGNGLHMVGTAQTNDPELKGGPASSTIDTLAILSNGGSGVYVSGSDANINNFSNVSSTRNDSWNFEDHSFLGNRYYGCHSAASSVGAYKSSNPNARNLYSCCYVEGGSHIPIEIDFPALIVGGIGMANNVGTGQYIGDGKLSPFDVHTEAYGKVITIRYGEQGTPRIIAVEGDGNGWHFDTLDSRSWCMETKHRAANSRKAYRLTTDLSVTSEYPPTDENNVPLQGGEMLLQNVRYHVGGYKYRRIKDELDELNARLQALEGV
jgi:hypothetical protein